MTAIKPESPAAKSNLKVNDKILQVRSIDQTSHRQFNPFLFILNQGEWI